MSNKKSGDVPPSGHTIPMPSVKPPADVSDLKQAKKLLKEWLAADLVADVGRCMDKTRAFLAKTK